MSFTEKLDVKLIRNVKNNPVLYDHSHSRYMDFNEREVIWQKIGDELRRPAAECKARWINIRDIYRRKLRKQMSYPGQCRKKSYKYENEISFLRSYYREVVPHPVDFDDNVDDEMEDNGAVGDEGGCEPEHGSYNNECSDESEDKKPIKLFKKKLSGSVTSRKKKKKSYVKVETLPSSSSEVQGPSEFDTSDPVDAFLLSIGATLKTFSPYHLNLAKSEIFAVVQQHDLKQIVEKQNQDLIPSQGDVKVSTMDSMYGNV